MSPTDGIRRWEASGLLLFVVVAWGGSFVAARHLLAPADPAAVALSPTLLAATRFLIAAVALAPFLLRLSRRSSRRSRLGGTTLTLAFPKAEWEVSAPAAGERMSVAASTAGIGWPRPGDGDLSPCQRAEAYSPSTPTGGRALLRDLLTFLLLGQVGITLYFWLQYTGVQLTGAGVAAVLVVGLIPLATLLVAGLTLRERIGWRRVMALLLGAVGVGIVASQRGTISADPSGFLLGAFCLVADAFLFAGYSTLVRGLRARYSALTVTAGITISGAAGLTGLAAIGEDWSRLWSLSAIQWGAVLYLGLGCSVLAYLAYNRALATIEASRAAAWLYLEPVVAVLLGTALLGESVALATVAGSAIIVGALYASGRKAA